MRNDHGLFVMDLPDGTVQAVGYIIDFPGHGAFDPNGKLVSLRQEEIATHNRLLAEAEMEALKKNGRGILYLTCVKTDCDQHYDVHDWMGNIVYRNASISKSFHNFCGRNGRTDVWFTFDGSRWHGVNIGDNQILRVKRLKS